jgi:hypothetical protein
MCVIAYVPENFDENGDENSEAADREYEREGGFNGDFESPREKKWNLAMDEANRAAWRRLELALIDAAVMNGDGFGFAYIVNYRDDNPKLCVKRYTPYDTSIEGVIVELKKARQSSTEGSSPLLIHLRYATHGAICEENCQPVIIKSGEVAVAHNGIFNFVNCDGDKSDSVTFFEQYLEKMESGFWNTEIRYLKQVCGSGNKLAFLDAKGGFRAVGSGWKIYNHCLWSNLNWLEAR